jgi:hypothetical protein
VTAALGVTNGNVRDVAAWAEHRDPATTLLYDDDRTDRAGEIAQHLAALVLASPRQAALPLDPPRELVEARQREPEKGFV